MKNILSRISSSWQLTLLLVCSSLLATTHVTMAAETNSGTALRAKYAELHEQLSQNQFKRPLYLDSEESSSRLKGDIYALTDHPIAAVETALNGATHWCDVLILHLNTKYCQASEGPSPTITLRIGKKFDQPIDDAYRVQFAYKVATSQPDYFDVTLNAKNGPLGTSDYRISVEAVSLPNGKTFLHLTYSYAYGFTGRIAMQAYLGTVASDKVGFTKIDAQADNKSQYIGGVRGLVERNTMRYYLAIEAYLDALVAPPSQQLEKRLQNWFNSTELYPRQLHEMDRAAYLTMKRGEYQRQQQVSSGR